MNLLFNMKELDSLLNSFYTLTKFRVAIFDKDFNEVRAYPYRLSNFCKTIRSDKTMNEKCKLCDCNAFNNCRKNNFLYIYKCHAGLTEAIAPIYSANQIIAYIMFGQVFCKTDNLISWDIIKNYCSNTLIDLKQLEKSFHETQIVESNVITASAKILETCATYLYSSNKIKLEENSFALQIDHYITQHLQENIEVPDLYHYFNMGKTTFYKVTKSLFGVSIAQHITQIRIQKAKEYLANTNYPIYKIADMVGISDYNYFTKVFKRKTHCTPREYRKLNF